MISKDIIGPLMIARDAQITGLRTTTCASAAHQFKRIGAVLSILEEAAQRVAAMEASPIPAHWRQQPVALADMPANVVPLRPVRHIPIHHGGAA